MTGIPSPDDSVPVDDSAESVVPIEDQFPDDDLLEPQLSD